MKSQYFLKDKREGGVTMEITICYELEVRLATGKIDFYRFANDIARKFGLKILAISKADNHVNDGGLVIFSEQFNIHDGENQAEICLSYIEENKQNILDELSCYDCSVKEFTVL